MSDTERQNGPDFLDSFADANLSNGLETNAAEFRQRAKDWRADQQRIADLEATVGHQARQLVEKTDRDRLLGEIKTQLQAANDTLASATAASAA